MDLMKDIAQSKAALKTAKAVLRIASFARSIGLPFHGIAQIKSPELKTTIVAFAERISDLIPKNKVLALLGVPQRRFAVWKKGQKLCPSSPLGSLSLPHSGLGEFPSLCF